MKKTKKMFAWILTLVFAASFGVACGGNSGSNTDSSSSENLTESSQNSEIISESIEDSSEIVESSSESEESLEESSESSENSESVHTCITEGEWISNKSGHYLKCDCGELVGYERHSGTAPDCESQPICDTCGASYGNPVGHTYGELSDGDAGKAYYCKCGAYLTNTDLVDFVVEVESGKDPVVLHISDTQIMNYGDVETLCYRYVRDAVQKTNPDLIILTGDIVYGKFDPNGTILKSFINFMETLDTPWAPVFGNHDNESLKGVDWQCAQLEAAENCLFKQGDLTGNGNYSVGIEQDDKLLRVFYMMDSNGCSNPMIDSEGNKGTNKPGENVVKTSAGFGNDQINWYKSEINAIHAVDADVKISMAYHIQQAAFGDAFKKYDEYDSTLESGSSSTLANPLNLDDLETADNTDFGFIGATMKGPWDYGNVTFNGMKDLGVDSLFVGHEHCNSASILYDGVRFQYGQKTSQYDRYNYLASDGTIHGSGYTAIPSGATPIMGGTVIPISVEDGSIGTGYIVYYGDLFAEDEN